MNADEIVRALRDKCKDCSMRKICLKGEGPLYYCPVKQAADLIESLQAQRDAAIADMKEVLSEGGYGCDYCKHDGDREKCTKRCSPATQMNLWQWRGLDAGEGERDG